MSYTALYRKYRPDTFSDVYGREIIVEILKNSIVNNKISHAYLFSGTRGTGKTTLARIFARAVNCQKFENDVCGTCDMCVALKNNDIDIVEIDAASNNGVDEIREIRNNAKLLPSVAKYKVYIIDEVHMLSTGAFNALLKTLEEPPSHVIFILATTEINKIPLTILSRCIRFDFSKFSPSKLKERLLYICEKESFTVSDEVLDVISELSDGGMRDAINLLDQVTSLNINNISVEDVYRVSGAISSNDIFELFRSAINNNISEGFNIIAKMYDDGKNFLDVVNKMITFLRDYKLNRIINEYFSESYSSKLSTLEIDSDQSNEILNILYSMNNQIKNSINQKTIFEIYYLMIFEIFNNVENDNKNGIIKLSTIPSIAENISENKLNNLSNDSVKTIDYNKIMNVRLNNIFATADKQELKNALDKFDLFNDYISNKKYMLVANILVNSKIVAASSDRLLFSVSDDVTLLTFYNNLNSIQNFVKKVYEKDYVVSAVTEEMWEEKKKEFVINIRNGVKYSIEQESSVETESVSNGSKVESSAVEVFGEESVDVI